MIRKLWILPIALLLVMTLLRESRAAETAQARTILQQAEEQYLKGNWKEADTLFKRALTSAASLKPGEHARLLEEYALIARATERNHFASGLRKQAEEIAKGLPDRPCPKTMPGLNQNNCDVLRRAFDRLPLLPRQDGTWSAPEEDRLREKLKYKFQITIPADVFPIGFIERTPKANGPYIVMFGRKMGAAGRIEPYLFSGVEDGLIFKKGAYGVDKTASINRVGYYGLHRPHAKQEGSWLELKGRIVPADEDNNGMFKTPAAELGSWLSCQDGLWLCPKEPFIQFPKSDDGTHEVIHLRIFTEDMEDEQQVYEPDTSGNLHRAH